MNLAVFWAASIASSTIDVDVIPTPLLNCCICDGPETPAQKLVQATPIGYPALLAYAEAIGNAAIVERMKEAYKFKRLRYHRESRRDLYNESVKVTTKSTRKCDSFY